MIYFYYLPYSCINHIIHTFFIVSSFVTIKSTYNDEHNSNIVLKYRF